jgi:hypothetical protein
MQKNSTEPSPDPPLFAGEDWFDPIEAGIRERIRGFIEELIEGELNDALGRARYQRAGPDASSNSSEYRHGRRERQLLGSFGPVVISVPRARLVDANGASREWRSTGLPRYARVTRQAEALIAGAYLSGTNTRRVSRALAALFKGAVSKDTVSRTWRKVQKDWEAWSHRSLVDEILSGWFSMARSFEYGWIAVQRRSHCWWCWASDATVRRCYWRCAIWAGRAKRHGVLCSMTLSPAGCKRRNSSLSTVRRLYKKRSV